MKYSSFRERFIANETVCPEELSKYDVRSRQWLVYINKKKVTIQLSLHSKLNISRFTEICIGLTYFTPYLIDIFENAVINLTFLF
jgi:hypothetical protein